LDLSDETRSNFAAILDELDLLKEQIGNQRVR
jgi:hypothetical protein